MRNRQFVVTSTNAERAKELAATQEDVFEIVGKPYDLSQICDAVRQATRARPVRDRTRNASAGNA